MTEPASIAATATREPPLKGVKGVTHYVALIFIGALSLFPMYFMAVSGLRNGIQLEKNPFTLPLTTRSGSFTARPGIT